MFEKFYTTKMSTEKKTLEDRFAKISDKRKKFSRTVIIVISGVLLIGTLSVSAVFAAFDKDKTVIVENETEKISVDDTQSKDIEATKVQNETKIDEKQKNSDSKMIVSFTNPIVGDLYITSKFEERTNPATGVKISHNGVDIEAEEGALVLASIGGKVQKAEFNSNYGNYVLVADDDGNSVLTAHLSEILVAGGDEVKVGQIIGKVGSTGMATGPHLHFEMKMDDEYINPERVLIKNREILDITYGDQSDGIYYTLDDSANG